MKNRYCALIMAAVFSGMSFTTTACEGFDVEFEMQIAVDAYNTCVEYDEAKQCFDEFTTRMVEIDREVSEIHEVNSIK